MKRTRRRPPYKPDGSTNFPARHRSAVYMIYYDNAAPVYIGYGARDAYKPLYRHFQQWNDRTRTRTTFDRDAHTVRVIYTRNAQQAARLERALILKYRPKGNPDKLEQHELTDALATLADTAESAPWTRSTEAAPF